MSVVKPPPSPSSPFLVRHLSQILIGCGILLGLRILLGILYEYRWYFPPNFTESFFLAGHTTDFAGFWKVGFYVHILASPIVLLLAVFLQWKRSRRNLSLHRYLGRVQMLMIFLLIVPSGLVLSMKATAGPVAQIGFFALSVATGLTAAMALCRARQKKVNQHRVWATRLFVLLLSPLFLRVCSGVAIVAQLDSPTFYQINAWTSWIVPWLCFEAWRAGRWDATMKKSISHA